MFSFLRPKPAAHDVAHEEMQQLAGKPDCVIVDVREPHEYAAGHIPGARNLPLSRFDAAALPADKPVVLVCQAGSRSLRALKALHETGRGDVRHYPPGTGGWVLRGGALHKPR